MFDEKEYEVKHDLEHMRESEHIKNTPAKLKAVRELATKEVEKLNAVLAVPVKTISEREARARVRNESAFMSNKRYAAGETNDG